MQRTFIKDTTQRVGENVRVFGWVRSIREHSKLVFIDLRDWTGMVQVVFSANLADYEKAKRLSVESVVAISGQVQARPKSMENAQLPTGKIEIAAQNLEILSQAKNIPFDVQTDGQEISEEKRLKYRYLDLRRERMKNNLVLRHRIIKFIRDYLDGKGFVEIETPILTKSTPEGARDYVVPSRLQKGKFYALPQSPQQYKQLLQVGGVERYFQIAKCFRDEDTRADRLPEFTQLDLEMSFVEREEVMELNEKLIIEIIRELVPEKRIQEIPFPHITFKEAMIKYGTDRPDLRKDKGDPNLLAFCWVVDFPFFEKDKEGKWTFTHNPFSAPKPEHYDWLLKKERIEEILTSQYDIVLNGLEIGGGSIRNSEPGALKSVFEVMGYEGQAIQSSFGHMLEAFSFGAPPHGGIAWGLDRFVAILANESSIREVIAFPKTGDGRDLMMDVPSVVTDNQLEDLGIKVVGEKAKTKRKQK
jgi:aspartyl-tRNA synthetase